MPSLRELGITALIVLMAFLVVAAVHWLFVPNVAELSSTPANVLGLEVPAVLLIFVAVVYGEIGTFLDRRRGVEKQDEPGELATKAAVIMISVLASIVIYFAVMDTYLTPREREAIFSGNTNRHSGNAAPLTAP